MQKPSEAETQLQYLAQDLLDFDPENPRFGGLMKDRSQNEIQKTLIEEPYFASELVDSLLKNGFIDYEPLVVRRNRNRYTVIEGNRRLAAIREILHAPEKYQGKTADLHRIPALVFPAAPDHQQQREMSVYLAVRHLLGFRAWPPLSKAIYLDRQSAQLGGLSRVFEETQIRKREAKRLLVPYRLLKKAGTTPPDQDYWMLGEALERTGVKHFLDLEVDPNTLEIRGYKAKELTLLLDWLYGPKLRNGARDSAKRIVDDTRDLTRLSKVLGSEVAASKLRSGEDLESAELFVDTQGESAERLREVVRRAGAVIRKVVKGSRDPRALQLLRAFKEFETAVKVFQNQDL